MAFHMCTLYIIYYNSFMTQFEESQQVSRPLLLSNQLTLIYGKYKI